MVETAQAAGTFQTLLAVDGQPCTQRNFDAAKEAAGAGGTLALTTFRVDGPRSSPERGPSLDLRA